VFDQTDQALKLEGFLLRNGYAANAVRTDFSELKEEKREAAGSVRLIYTSKAQKEVQGLQEKLTEFGIKKVTTSKNDSLNVSNLEIQMF
jgi:hypothetical protein